MRLQKPESPEIDRIFAVPDSDDWEDAMRIGDLDANEVEAIALEFRNPFRNDH